MSASASRISAGAFPSVSSSRSCFSRERRAKAVSPSVPKPGPTAMAEKGVGSMSELQHRSEPSSICSTASGTAICKTSRPHRGMCTVTLPTPLRSAARAASTAAPIMPSWPAMRRRCPNVPLCPSEGRFFHFSTNHWREMICALLASMLQKYAF